MRLLMIVLLLTAPGSWAQEPTPQPASPEVSPAVSMEVVQEQSPQQSPEPVPQQSSQPSPPSAPVYASDQPPSPPPAPAKQVLTLPAGTRIPLVLTNSIGRKLSQPGDAVRATVAFPVSIGNSVAIPLGTYAEGAVASVIKPSSSHQIGLKINFTRLIFANGYAVDIPGATAEAKLDSPDTNSLSASATASPSVMRNVAAIALPSLLQTSLLFAMFAKPQQLPPPPPFSNPGPPTGFIVGAVVSAVATVVILAFVAFGHHRTRTDEVLAPGAPVDLILVAPLTLDAGNVAAAAAISSR
jgi:hypothetical protein